MPRFVDWLGVLRLVKVSIRVKRRWFVCETVTRKVFEETKSSDGTELVGCSGVLAPMKIFRGRQKLEKGANDCITNDARTPFVGRNSEFGKTEELFNSLGRFCFAEVRVAKTARTL